MSADQRVRDLGLELPEPQPIVGEYLRVTRQGDLLFLAGHPPIAADGSVVTGKLGAELSTEDGRRAARTSALSILATLREELGALDLVRRILNVRGFINSTPDFVEHTPVLNGASDLLIEVFGDAGRHARSAIGVPSLPWNIAIEVEAVVDVER